MSRDPQKTTLLVCLRFRRLKLCTTVKTGLLRTVESLCWWTPCSQKWLRCIHHWPEKWRFSQELVHRFYVRMQQLARAFLVILHWSSLYRESIFAHMRVLRLFIRLFLT